jgi:hypothetical protein
MNIKQLLNKAKTHQAKTFLLAGLMGLMPSCKIDRNAPESPESSKSSTHMAQSNDFDDSTMPVDSFMKHMDNVSSIIFYEPLEDTHRFLFHTDPITQNVTGFQEICDVRNSDPGIHYPINATRTDYSSVGHSANFLTDKLYYFGVGYTLQNGMEGSWSIDNMSQEDFERYSQMPKEDLANLAKNRILSKNPNDSTHSTNIYNMILNGYGVWDWVQYAVTFNSKGAQQNLRYSDFGTFDATPSGYNQSFNCMFSGGNQANEIDKSLVQPQTFQATAYGNVEDHTQGNDGMQLVFSTGKDSAMVTIDAAQNETIVMPFKNWYTVTIIRTPYSVISRLEDDNGNVQEQWQNLHPGIQENVFRSGVQENGLFMQDGLSGNDMDGILTGTALNYYTDETGYVEFVGQGYRQDWTNTKKLVLTFSIGGTNRPRPEENVATGLENVYCAPARQR